MTGEQNNQLIDIERATTFEEALDSALGAVGSMICWNENDRLISITHEVKYIDREFKKEVINEYTLAAFYNAVLVLHSNLILFSDFNNKDRTFTQKASIIHLKVIGKIKCLETQALKQGYFLEDRLKYLNIWKELLKEIIHLCYQYSENKNASQNNVSNSNKNFLFKPIHFPKISLSSLKKLLSTRISFKFQTGSVAEKDNKESQSPGPANQSGVSREMINMAITIIVFVIGITLALTLFR